MGVDRRRTARVAFRNGILPPRARARPGGEVIVVNLSGSGALIEGTFRFRPDARCELAIVLADRDSTLLGRVVRSFVARLERAGPVRYRAAITFERLVQLPSTLGALDGYGVPENLLGSAGPGVGATREPGKTGDRQGKTDGFSQEVRRR